MKYLDQIMTVTLLITNAVSYHRQIYIQAVSAKSVIVPLCISCPSHARGKNCPCLQGSVKVRRKIITCHRFSVYYLHLYLLKLKVQLDERLIKGG